MLKSKKSKIFIAACVVVIIVLVIVFTLMPSKDESTIEGFVKEWLSISESNQKLCEEFEKNRSVIGQGDVDTAETIEEKKAAMAEAVKKNYGKYLTDSGLEIFNSDLLGMTYSLCNGYEKVEMPKVEVKDEGGYYTFKTTMNLTGGKETIFTVAGKVEMKDGKIDRVEIREGGNLE